LGRWPVTNRRKLIAAILAASALLVGIAAANSDPRRGKAVAAPIQLDEASVIVEINDTDGDAGLQVFVDAEPWRSLTVTGPTGKEVGDLLKVNAKGRLENYGLTELFSESNEPPFDVFPLKRFKRKFPEGRYTFSGSTIDGQPLVGSARLSHDFPDGPNTKAPADGATVARGGVVARWGPGGQPQGVDLIGYRVIVTRENPLRVFSADLRPSARTIRIPWRFLEPGTEYQLEIQTIDRSGNQTSTDTTFTVEE
jgi:hypothetical protein